MKTLQLAKSLSIAVLFTIGSISATCASDEISALQSEGFVSKGGGVWEKVDEAGVKHRVGFGPESDLALLDRMHEHKDALSLMLKSGADDDAVRGIRAAIANMSQSILELKDTIGAQSSLKASGMYNGCPPPFDITANASVSTSTRSATSTATATLFGPTPPATVVRMAVAQAVSQVGTPSVVANIGLSGSGPAVSAFASSPGSGSCSLYSFAHSITITTGCGRWADAIFTGSC